MAMKDTTNCRAVSGKRKISRDVPPDVTNIPEMYMAIKVSRKQSAEEKNTGRSSITGLRV